MYIYAEKPIHLTILDLSLVFNLHKIGEVNYKMSIKDNIINNITNVILEETRSVKYLFTIIIFEKHIIHII